MKKEQNKTIPGGKNGKPEFIPSERRRSGQADPDIDCMFFGGSSVSCADPGQGYQRTADAGVFLPVILRSFFETCEIYADSSELNSILVVSDGTEHEAALHNLMVDFFALLKTDGYLIKEDPSLATLRKFIQGKDYLNSSWTSQLHTAERLHVIYLAVAPKMQHHGLAEKLMDEVIDYADRHKLMIFLETHNPANVSMYEKFGFKLYGIVQKKGFDLKQYCMIKQA